VVSTFLVQLLRRTATGQLVKKIRPSLEQNEKTVHANDGFQDEMKQYSCKRQEKKTAVEKVL
jgi:hypothetical protein